MFLEFLYSLNVFHHEILQDERVNLLSVSCRVEKYRPKHLDDLISHKDIIGTSEWTSWLHILET